MSKRGRPPGQFEKDLLHFWCYLSTHFPCNKGPLPSEGLGRCVCSNSMLAQKERVSIITIKRRLASLTLRKAILADVKVYSIKGKCVSRRTINVKCNREFELLLEKMS